MDGGNDFWNDGLEQQSESPIDWGASSQESMDEGWGTFENTGVPQQEPVEQFEDIQPQQGGYAGEVQERQPPKVSTKVAGIILAGLILVVALVFVIIDSIKVTPKQETSQPVQTVSQAPTQGQAQAQASNSNDVNLIYVPDSTTMNYSGDVFEATGTVSAKNKYVQNRQVVYCIQIKIAAGSTSEVVNFYCNYATFSAVGVGDLVLVKYQQVSDNFISVNEVTK